MNSESCQFRYEGNFHLCPTLKTGERRNALSSWGWISKKIPYPKDKAVSNAGFLPNYMKSWPLPELFWVLNPHTWVEDPEQTYTGRVSTPPGCPPRVSWRGPSAVSWAECFIALWPLAFRLWTDEVLGHLALGESTWIGYHITFLMDGLQNAQALDWVETAELFLI